MTIEEFNARLSEFDGHIAAVMQMFEEDTGVKIGFVEACRGDDDYVFVRTGLDFPSVEETN